MVGRLAQKPTPLNSGTAKQFLFCFVLSFSSLALPLSVALSRLFVVVVCVRQQRTTSKCNLCVFFSCGLLFVFAFVLFRLSRLAIACPHQEHATSQHTCARFWACLFAVRTLFGVAAGKTAQAGTSATKACFVLLSAKCFWSRAPARGCGACLAVCARSSCVPLPGLREFRLTSTKANRFPD